VRTLVATLVRIVVLLLVAAPIAAQAQLPSFRIWPDTLPPCDTTLQACINGSGADDAIDVATNGPIDETLILNRSLELAAVPGFRPMLAANRGILALPDGGDRFYLIKGFQLLGGTISIANHVSGWLNAWVLDNEAEGISVGSFNTGGPLSFRIEGNVVTPEIGNLSGILVYATNAFGGGVQTNTVAGNTVTMPPTNDATAIDVSAQDGSMTADIVGNRVTGAFYKVGIRVSADESPLNTLVANNLVSGATAPFGSGIVVFGQGSDGVRDVDIVNNTVAGNVRGIMVGQRDARVANNIISGNTLTGLTLGLAAPAIVNDHNLFFGNDLDTEGQPAGPGSLFVDPHYTDLVDFRPLPTSPVVDGGADDAVPAKITTDFAGDPRRIGTVDIGAYEVPEPSAALGAAAALLALVIRSRSARPIPKAKARPMPY